MSECPGCGGDHDPSETACFEYWRDGWEEADLAREQAEAERDWYREALMRLEPVEVVRRASHMEQSLGIGGPGPEGMNVVRCKACGSQSRAHEFSHDEGCVWAEALAPLRDLGWLEDSE